MTAPSPAELLAFERYVLTVRTTLEELNGGLAIAASWGGRSGNYAADTHLSAMLARSVWLYSEGRVERAQRYLGYVQGVMAVKYGLGQSELELLLGFGEGKQDDGATD